MTQPINLNRYRKARARKAGKDQADRNAAYHGLTKAEKQRARDEAELTRRTLDHGKLDPPEDET